MSEADYLRKELECFRQEREQVRQVLGQIGGDADRSRERLVNIGFLVAVGAFFALGLAREIFGLDLSHLSPTLSVEIAVLLVSLKITWMMQRQTRVEHFQFWILTSIEFRIGAIDHRLADLEKTSREALGAR
jgi:hypothetical protein